MTEELIEEKTDDEVGEEYFSITNRGIEFVEAELDRALSDMRRYAEGGKSWLFSEVTREEVDQRIPASDRIVQLDHNSAEYQETVESVDTVIESVRGDNEYGERDPEDKEQRLSGLRAGKQLLQSVRVSVKSVETVLIKALLYLAGTGVAVSEITDAIAKVKALLGL